MNQEQEDEKLIPTQFKDEEEWVEYYTKSHLSTDFNYRESYLPYLVLDRLLENYSLLEIGCGTAGYIKLLPNLNHFTGIDWSQKMVDAAKKLNPKHEFMRTLFKDYQTEKRFDAIIDFATGIYDRPDQKNIDKIFALLEPKGVAVVAVRSHRISPKEKIGDIVKRRRNLKISEQHMLSLCSKFKQLFRISKKSGSLEIEVYFLQKP